MFVNRRSWLVGAIVCLILIVTGTGCGTTSPTVRKQQQENGSSARSEELSKLERLGEAAEELYHATAGGDLATARTTLDRIAEQVPSISYTGITTLEGLKALTDTVEESKRVFSAVKFSGEEANRSAVKLRLVTDALTHKQSPMWLQFEGTEMEAVRQVKSAAAQKLASNLTSAVTGLDQKYRLIRPSLYVSREPADVEKIDSLLTALSKQSKANPIVYGDVEKTAAMVEQVFKEVFHRPSDKTAYLPIEGGDTPILWTLFMGSFIIAILSFVAWRMFHSDKSIARVPRNKGGL